MPLRRRFQIPKPKVLTLEERQRDAFAKMNPDTVEIVWALPGRCSPGLFSRSTNAAMAASDKGCGYVTRWWYARYPLADCWNCPVCGRRASFSFWKVRTHEGSNEGGSRTAPPATPEQEADVRALLRDLHEHAKRGTEFSYDMPIADRLRIHAFPLGEVTE